MANISEERAKQLDKLELFITKGLEPYFGNASSVVAKVMIRLSNDAVENIRQEKVKQGGTTHLLAYAIFELGETDTNKREYRRLYGYIDTEYASNLFLCEDFRSEAFEYQPNSFESPEKSCRIL